MRTPLARFDFDHAPVATQPVTLFSTREGDREVLAVLVAGGHPVGGPCWGFTQ
jgi:hypothetical protein